jgi:hypothetical protein
MGKIVVTEFVSLDGVMDDPGGSEGSGHGGSAFKFHRGPEGDQFKLDEFVAAEGSCSGWRRMASTPCSRSTRTARVSSR